MKRATALVVALLTWTLIGCDPPPAPTGIVTSPAEVDQLPTSGPAWEAVSRAARASWGTPNLGDNNSIHDTSVLAGAIVAVRLNDPDLTARVRTAVGQVIACTCYARALEASRNITAYVLAADLIGLDGDLDARWRTFLSQMRTKPLAGHSGAENIRETALYSANNWGAMARAAMVAIDLYLNDTVDLDPIVATHRAWLGETVPNELDYSSTRWHTTPPAGINPRGATAAGCSSDGVLPEDQRRTGEPACPAAKGSYPWEALQGAVLTGVMLDRAGLVPFNAGDNALIRAATWLTVTNRNPASGDDLNTPWLLNAYGGSFSTTTPTRPGKNFAWADYLETP